VTRRLPHGCRGCDNRWSGLARCHCSVCHLTFGGLAPFDAHQINGKCLNVRASRNFFESDPGVWSHQTLAKSAVTPGSIRRRKVPQNPTRATGKGRP
jgi:hypothetical protein